MRTLQIGVMIQNTQEPEGQQQLLQVRCRPGEFLLAADTGFLPEQQTGKYLPELHQVTHE